MTLPAIGRITANWNRYLGRTRLLTGLVLFSYVLTHNLNHALGIVSLQWLEGPYFMPSGAFRRSNCCCS